MDRARAERIIENQILSLYTSAHLTADYWAAWGFIEAYHAADFISKDIRNHYMKRLNKLLGERRQVMGALAA
ncbi:hypothetical protein VPH49_26295 [Pseudomonas luteola]|uniref:hypothetical protein n=1 Tax=Pseudomonas luteola TaxID=47886 RepID=UPI003A8675A6